MEINGIAHIFVTVARFEACRPFYRELLSFLGLKPALDGDGFLYYVGGRTAFGVRAASETGGRERFDPGRPGLHHVCFRARSRDDVDALHAWLVERGAAVVHPPEEAGWAPGYYSVLFEDPDGLRLEMNHVPGRGLLERIEASG